MTNSEIPNKPDALEAFENLTTTLKSAAAIDEIKRCVGEDRGSVEQIQEGVKGLMQNPSESFRIQFISIIAVAAKLNFDVVKRALENFCGLSEEGTPGPS